MDKSYLGTQSNMVLTNTLVTKILSPFSIFFFRCAISSLYEVVSVRRSVHRPVGWSVGRLVPRYFRR